MPNSDAPTTLGLLWHARYWLFRALHSAALRSLPPGRYKSELNAALWTLGLRVQAHWAAGQAAKIGATDVE